MVIAFGGGTAGAVVRLRCPKCGEVQLRARAEKGALYTCRACHKAFKAEEARKAEENAKMRARARARGR